VAEAESRVPASQLEAEIAAFDAAHGKPLSLFERIRAEERPIALAAEFKRASPSKGTQGLMRVFLRAYYSCVDWTGGRADVRLL
jgi:indole-3-glycerol phosphate synthase